MRSQREIEERRAKLNDDLNKVLTGVVQADDPHAATVGLATRMHELDWVMGRNDG